MTQTEGNYPSPENPELVPCECHRCNNLYRVVCTGYGEAASAFCVKCGSKLERISPGAAEWINSSFRDADALTADGVKPPATERAPTLTMPRITEKNILRLRRAQYALTVADALEQYATWGEDNSVRSEAAEWRERARRDGTLPIVTPLAEAP